MSAARTFLGVTRALIGIGSWVAPDLTARLFGIDPDRSDRFLTRLFGAREPALAGGLLAARDSAPAPVAAVGVAGFDDRRRGNLSTQATVLGPVGALLFVALGVLVARRAVAAQKPPSEPLPTPACRRVSRSKGAQRIEAGAPARSGPVSASTSRGSSGPWSCRPDRSA
jgi:hypothetical protein